MFSWQAQSNYKTIILKVPFLNYRVLVLMLVIIYMLESYLSFSPLPRSAIVYAVRRNGSLNNKKCLVQINLLGQHAFPCHYSFNSIYHLFSLFFYLIFCPKQANGCAYTPAHNCIAGRKRFCGIFF